MTAIHSRSVSDFQESPHDHLLLPYAITFATPSMHCVIIAKRIKSLVLLFSPRNFISSEHKKASDLYFIPESSYQNPGEDQ